MSVIDYILLELVTDKLHKEKGYQAKHCSCKKYDFIIYQP